MANEQGYYTRTTRFQIQMLGNATNNSGSNEETQHEVVEITRPMGELADKVPLQFSTNLFVVFLNGTLFVHMPRAPSAIDALSLPVHQLHDRSNLVRTYIQRTLRSVTVTRKASDAIAAHVVSFLLRQNAVNFRASVIVDNIQQYTFIPLPSTIHNPLEKKEEEPGSGVCAICLDRMFDNTKATMKTSCGHVYHEVCILTWLNNSDSCPLCRGSLLL